MLKHVIFLAAIAFAHGQEAYDAHYDGLAREAQLEEKGKYPKEVYEYLLEHRKTLV